MLTIFYTGLNYVHIEAYQDTQTLGLTKSGPDIALFSRPEFTFLISRDTGFLHNFTRLLLKSYSTLWDEELSNLP